METRANPTQAWRFGVFEVDARNMELRRSGTAVKIREQSFNILVFLLEHAGELVTREDLRRVLWPSDTFVDFDHSLNAAVMKLREALGDSADAPLYIETIPKRGYRFIAPVSQEEPPQAISAEASGPSAQAAALGSDLDPEQVTMPESGSAEVMTALRSRWRSHSRWLWTAAAIVVAFGALLIAWWRIPPAVPVVDEVTQLTDDGEQKQGEVFTDGSRVYFNEGQSGSLKIAEVSVTGGRTALVETKLPSPWIVGLVPDGSSLLVLAGGPNDATYPMWSIPLPAGDPRRLGDAQVQDAEYFPDGRIIYAQGRVLYAADRDGANPRKLASVSGGLVWSPKVSPDGKRIVFSQYSRDTRTFSLFESASDGTDVRAIPNASQDVSRCCAAWTSNGKDLIYSTLHGGVGDLWLLPLQAQPFHPVGKAVRLTNGQLSFGDGTTGSSRDGKQIFAIGTKRRGELVRYDMESKQFLPFLSGISATDPTFSSDGNWVAYLSYPDHTLWRSRTDGTDRMQLTYSPMEVAFPFLSPDAKMVAFSSRGASYVVSTEGGPPQRIVERNSIAPNWSLDGNLLLFNSRIEGKQADQIGMFELHIFDLRTGKVSVVPSSEGKMGALWATQNTLVASNYDRTKFQTFDFKTQKWADLTSGSFVNWLVSPDRKYLYYTTGGGEPMTLRIRFADRQIETITSLKAVRRVVDSVVGNTQIDIAPNGSPIFTRDVGTQEIYALKLGWH